MGQGDEAQQQVPQAPEVLDAGAAGEEVDAHGDQGETDGDDHGAGDHGREELPEGLDEEAQAHLEHAAHDAGAHEHAVGEDARVGVGGDGARRDAAHGADGDGVIDADEAGGGAHDDGEPAADGADGVQLNEGDETRDHHGVLQQRHPQRAEPGVHGEPAGAQDDQQGRQVADEHGQNVLQAQGDGLAQRDPSVQFIGRGVDRFLFHYFPSLHWFTYIVYWVRKGKSIKKTGMPKNNKGEPF